MVSLTLRLNRTIMIVPNDRYELMAVNTSTGSAFQVTRDDFSIMETFAGPTLIDAAIDTVKTACNGKSEDEIRSRIEKLREQKLLVPDAHQGLARYDMAYFGAYQHLNNQREMLLDSARTRAFADALEEIVGSEDIVFDVGSGSGILSLFAARSGAKKVYSIERSGIIKLAERIADKNGFSDVIKFSQCMAEKFTCSDRATVIASELLGDFVLRELSFKSFCSVRDRCAADNVRCIPSRVRMYAAPVEDAFLWQTVGPGYWASAVYGFDYSPAFDAEREALGSARTLVPETSLLSKREMLNDIDYEKTPVEDFYFDTRVEFNVCRNASLHGFSGSFDMQLSPSVWLDTDSYSKDTHWEQMFFPLIEALPVQKEDKIIMRMCVIDPANPHKRIPDTHIAFEVYRKNKLIHEYDQWYDKTRQTVF